MNFDLDKKTDRLHLLHGLEAILLDIDKAIAIIRGTKLEADVVPNLMKGFNIDQVQAEFVAEIKLRNINEEYIINRTKDIEELEADIAELNAILASEKKIKKVIHDELAAVNKKHVMPRKTGLVAPSEIVEVNLEPEVEEYPVTMMLSRDGYLKKMTDRVLRKATTLKYKDGDEPFIELRFLKHARFARVHKPVPGIQVQGCRVRRHQIGAAWARICPPIWRWTPTRP